MRWSRARRRKGLRTTPFEIRESEIEALVNRGYLDAAKCSDRFEVALALGRFLDRMLAPSIAAATTRSSVPLPISARTQS
jgi:hypothetical protein